MTSRIIAILRFSDEYQGGGTVSHKKRPSWFSKKRCFINFLKTWKGDDMIVIADKCSDETMQWLTQRCRTVIPTTYGSGAFSFMHAVQMATHHLRNEDIVYLVEDDYLHDPNCNVASLLREGLSMADYVTLYDHPDKYVSGGNPFVVNGGENTRVFCTQSIHWKITNSTTMTFAARVATLLKDLKVYEKYTHTGYPYDFAMFCELAAMGRTLVSSIPGKSTHCESANMTPHFMVKVDELHE